MYFFPSRVSEVKVYLGLNVPVYHGRAFLQSSYSSPSTTPPSLSIDASAVPEGQCWRDVKLFQQLYLYQQRQLVSWLLRRYVQCRQNGPEKNDTVLERCSVTQKIDNSQSVVTAAGGYTGVYPPTTRRQAETQAGNSHGVMQRLANISHANVYLPRCIFYLPRCTRCRTSSISSIWRPAAFVVT